MLTGNERILFEQFAGAAQKPLNFTVAFTVQPEAPHSVKTALPGVAATHEIRFMTVEFGLSAIRCCRPENYSQSNGNHIRFFSTSCPSSAPAVTSAFRAFRYALSIRSE